MQMLRLLKMQMLAAGLTVHLQCPCVQGVQGSSTNCSSDPTQNAYAGDIGGN